MRLGDAVTMRGVVIAAARAADLRGVATALSMTGRDGFGCFALTIRCGMGGDFFRFGGGCTDSQWARLSWRLVSHQRLHSFMVAEAAER